MSAARPPEGAQHRSPKGEGTLMSTAGPPQGAQHRSAQREGNPARAQTIAHLHGLGPKSQAMLASAGIMTVAQLRRIGSVRAYASVKATGAKASLNLLWALEGALTGLPWQVVAKEHRLSLLLALEALSPPRGHK
jgi:DNA transformation protein